MSDTSDKKEEEVSSRTCIVCQEDLNEADGKLFGALGLIQPSWSNGTQTNRMVSYGQLNEVLGSSSSLDSASVNIVSGNLGSTSGMGTSTPLSLSQADLLDSKAVPPNFEGFPSNYTRSGLHSSVCSLMMPLLYSLFFLLHLRLKILSISNVGGITLLSISLYHGLAISLMGSFLPRTFKLSLEPLSGQPR
jgi:hypothetical protein